MPAVARLQARFEQIAATSMKDMPVCNPALSVAAVGFRPCGDDRVGVLVTPWFMNLVLLPCEGSEWLQCKQGETAMLSLPSGHYELIAAEDPELGVYAACSLFSPMYEFGEQSVAIETAEAVMVSLFDEAHISRSERRELTEALAVEPQRENVADERLESGSEAAIQARPERLSRRGFITAGLAGARDGS